MIKHIIKLIWNKKGSNSLLILEIFLSFLVLFAVLAYVFFNLNIVNNPLGFEYENRWMVQLDNLDHLDSTQRVTMLGNLKSNLESLPEVEKSSFLESIAPFTRNTWRTGTSDNGFEMSARLSPCDYNLQEVIGLNVIEGRWFDESDLNAAIPPIIVNKFFMETYYPEKSMIDSTIQFQETNKIIGVVEDYRYGGEFEEQLTTVFTHNPFHENTANIVLKMQPNTSISVAERISDMVNTTTKTTGSTIVDLKQRKKENSRESWLLMIALLSVCGFLCINVALGLFGVLWYNINKRRSEIGLRQAIGATGFDITKQFILEIIILTTVALALGVFFAVQIPLLQVTEYPDALFYKSIFYAVIIILGLVFSCALFPSIQAARITPANSLHED